MPALDEEDALPAALKGRPSNTRIIVVDNGSTDATAKVASGLGVEVVSEPQRGFGAACYAGLMKAHDADVIVYMDADATCSWHDFDAVVDPIAQGNADVVLGRRLKRLRQPHAMPWHVGVANAVLGWACGRLAGKRLHDVPPYRAIRRTSLQALNLQDRTYGWPLEMVLRAAQENMKIVEVPVAYNRRVGTSKVTGSVRGTLRAATRMMSVMYRFWRSK